MMKGPRTYATATLKSAIAGIGNMSSIDDNNQSKNLKSINKNLNKLDQISQMNWSKKDFKIEAVATGN